MKISCISTQTSEKCNFLSNQASAIRDCSDQRATEITFHWSFLNLPLPTFPKHPCWMPQVSKVFLYPRQIVSDVASIWVLPLHYWHGPWVFTRASGLLKGLQSMWGSHSIFNPFSEVLQEEDWKWMLSYPIPESGKKGEKLKSVTRKSNPHSYLCFVFYKYVITWPEWSLHFKVIIMPLYVSPTFYFPCLAISEILRRASPEKRLVSSPRWIDKWRFIFCLTAATP